MLALIFGLSGLNIFDLDFYILKGDGHDVAKNPELYQGKTFDAQPG